MAATSFRKKDTKSASFTFTKEHLKILNKEHALHLCGKTKSYNWEEVKEIIRGKRTM